MKTLDIGHCLEDQECQGNSYLREIHILDAHTLSYHDFFTKYMIKNQVCLIKNITTHWSSAKDWVSKDSKPNFDYLKRNYSDIDVSVYNCNEKYYNSQKTTCFKFSDYVEYWKNFNSSSDVLYLKDWHLQNVCPCDNFYEVPSFFASDWLNEYLTECKLDDYRFVYMGPGSSWTPFHSDVFSSFSWSANVTGEKEWAIFVPGDENLLRDKFGNLPYDIKQCNVNIPHIKITQMPGDAIFVPSGWYHQVHNTKDTISINHNWVNGCNIKKMYLSIKDNLNLVKNEISDCRDMPNFLEHCQVMLKASFGMDFKEFYTFIKHIALKRLNYFIRNDNVVHFDTYRLSSNHVKFDLLKIKEVLQLFFAHEDIHYLIGSNCLENSKDILEQIVNNTNK